MAQEHRPDARYVIGPDGRYLTLADLPAPQTARWVARRKAEVVAAVDGGLISMDRACQLYRLTVEEFMTCEVSLHRFELAGLRITHAKTHRAGALRSKH